MVTLLFLKSWLKLAAVAGLAVLLELAVLGPGPWYWLALALVVTALVFFGISAALVSDWRAQRGSALYRFDTVRDVTEGRRW